MKKKYLLIILLSFIGSVWAYSQSTNRNYIHTRTIDPTGNNHLEEIKYYDGLGKPIQILKPRAANSGKSLVSLIDYDANSREWALWLPGVSPDKSMPAISAIQASVRTTNGDQFPYSAVRYESATMSRIIDEYGPGNDYLSGKMKKTEYLANNGTTGVLACAKYEITGNGLNTKFKRIGYYDNNTLFVTKYTTEQGDVSYEFKNLLGQTLLTRQINNSVNHDTYYIYDSFGRKCVVIPPMAADRLTTTGIEWNETNADVANYVYLYKYDRHGNCVRKKMPGANWIYYVYDKVNQLILSQDGEQWLKGEWQFNIPDIWGRTVLTGICKNTGISHTSLANVAVVASPNWNSSVYKYYSIANFTPATPTLLSVAYYDNYSFISKTEFSGLGYDSSKAIYNKRYGIDSDVIKHKGLLTGTMTALLDGSGTFIRTAMYYDDEQRLIQTQSTSHLAGGREKEYIAYNFLGKPTNRETVHMATGKTTQTEKYIYTYDQAFRLTSKKHQLNSGAVVELENNTYDDLGRLIQQNINNRAYLKSDYTYNVRSQIKSMSRPFFNYDLYYNESYNESTPRYDGNISAVAWYSAGERIGRSCYTFKYDSLSRLTTATFRGSNYRVPRISYDKNGNITNIERWGKNSSDWTFGLVDKLTLNYTGNQLKTVNETAGNIALAESADFKNYNSTNITEYTFNKNGAMTKDLNKGISDIQYNFLNLPKQIDVKNPKGEGRNEYIYSAAGNKLKVTHKWNSNFSTNPVIGSAISAASLNSQQVTDYVGNKVYVDNVLKRILVDGGYIENGEYYIYLKDHLGNNRLVLKENAGVFTQRMAYYPFGMPFADISADMQDVQPYKYGDKELDQKHGLNLYDFSARMMDHTVGRFTTMDPLAEKYYSLSPYAYCGNNPVNYVDPTGMTHYSMGADGRVSLMTDANGFSIGVGDGYDMLFFPGGLSTVVVDITLLPQLMQEGRNGYNGSYAETFNRWDAFNIFFYAATFTDVEWSLDGYRSSVGNKYVVSTSHEEGFVYPSTSIPGYNVFDQIFDMHSHPGKNGTKGASTTARKLDGKIYHDGDMKNIIDTYERFENAGMKASSQWFKKGGEWTVFPKHYVFHPYSGTLYNYTPWNSSIYIRDINKSSDLYRNLGF